MSIIILPNGTALHMEEELHLLTELQRDIVRIDRGPHPTMRDLAEASMHSTNEHQRMGRCACGADSDEAGHPFRSITGRVFRFHSGQHSDLKPATLALIQGRFE